MIQVQSTLPKEELEGDVDKDIKEFDDWVKTRGGPLHSTERAIIKTYLAWKLGVPNGA